ncbi:MAG: PAS domain S-box protein [Methanoregula sp.]|jgi:PAS domain S-box-containing protein|nr:PAS domain S-box protein [Methanoregula sp.]
MEQKGDNPGVVTGVKILIVDDDSKNLYMLEVLLKSVDYGVFTAKNGIEALEKLRANQFDGIVSDILMPRMDGFQLIRECKNDPVLRPIPFIFYTATYTDKKDEEFGLSLGAIRYIIKPTEPDELIRIINQCIRHVVSSPTVPVPDDVFTREYTSRVGAKLEKKTQLLAESEERFRLLYENSMDAILLTCPDGSIQEANPAACVMFQRTEKEIISNGRDGVIDSTDPRHTAALEERGRTGRFKGELTFLRNDGTSFPGEVFSNLFTDRHGQILTSMIIRDISERKRVEEEITFKNVILSTQMESSLDGILIVDESGKILNFNRKFTEIWGIPDDLIASRIDGQVLQFIVGQLADPEAFLARVRYLNDHKDENSFEEIFFEDGRILERFSAPMLGEKGKYYGRVWYFRDITERKRAEDELRAAYEQIAASSEELRAQYDMLAESERSVRESEEKYRTILDTTSEWIWDMDMDGRHTYSNPAIETLLGYNLDEFIGFNAFDLMHPQDRKRIEKVFTASVKEKKGWRKVIIRWRHKDGTYRVLESNATTIINERGELTGFRGADHDITESKQAEEALRESEEKFKTLFESAGDAILIMDNNVFLDCNKKTEHIFGCTRDRIIGKSIAMFSPLHQPDGQLSAKIVKEKINAAFLGETQFFELVHVRSDGTPINAEVTLNRFKVGGTFYLQEIVRDITERKRSQKALEQAKKKLNLLNYVTFNDIQNMLFTLSGYNYLVKDKVSESSVKLIIEKEDDILQKITHSLKFSQSYQDLGLRLPRWYNVNQVFLLAISHLDFLRMKHTVTLDGLEIFADPLLEQVFQILADNTLTHGKTATEVTMRYTEGSESLTVFFEDNGVGINEDIKDKIFSPDFQKKKGVGLFLAREIFEITGISITETGEPGKGARFEITIPKGQYRFTSQ